MLCTTGHPAELKYGRKQVGSMVRTSCPVLRWGGVARLAPMGQTENVVIHEGWTPNKGSLSHIYF